MCILPAGFLTARPRQVINVGMKHVFSFLALATVLAFTSFSAVAGDKLSDTQIKSKLLGYWQSPRHAYLIQANGIVYMCPRSICTTTNRWYVKGGLFYWDSAPHEILTLTGKTFVYREVGAPGPGYRLKRISKR